MLPASLQVMQAMTAAAAAAPAPTRLKMEDPFQLAEIFVL
jgi:hypothetical protein